MVLIDREQGGPARLAESGLALHSAFTLSSILKVLVSHNLVSSQVEQSVKAFLAENQTFQGSSSGAAPKAAPKPHRWSLKAIHAVSRQEECKDCRITERHTVDQNLE